MHDIFEKRKYKRMIKTLEDEGLTKYDSPVYKPVDLQDSIQWHEHVLTGLKEKSDHAETELRSYCQTLVNKEMDRRAEENRKPGFPDDPQIARMVFLPETDEKLKRLQIERDQKVSDMVSMEVKITRLRNLLKLSGNVKL